MNSSKKYSYVGLGIALGAGRGVAISVALDNTGVWLPTGVALGLIFGSILDAQKAKKSSKEI